MTDQILLVTQILKDLADVGISASYCERQLGLSHTFLNKVKRGKDNRKLNPAKLEQLIQLHLLHKGNKKLPGPGSAPVKIIYKPDVKKTEKKIPNKLIEIKSSSVKESSGDEILEDGVIRINGKIILTKKFDLATQIAKRSKYA